MRKREKDEEVPVDDDLYEQAKRASEDFARRSRNRAIAFAEKEEQEEEEADRRDLGGVARDALRGESKNAKTEQPVDIYAKNDARVQPDGKWEFQRPSPEKETDKKETANPNFFGSNDASGDVARLSELMSRYREASQRKQRDDDLGFVYSMTQRDPNAQRSLREGYSKAADEGIDSIDRELSGFKKQVDNDSSLLALARKRAMMDPDSPISKALREYEARNKQFGVGEDGLSAQDFVDTGRTTNPVFQQIKKSQDAAEATEQRREATEERRIRGDKDRNFKYWDRKYRETEANKRNNETNRYNLAGKLFGQTYKDGTQESKMATQFRERSFEMPDAVKDALGAQAPDWTIPDDGRIPSADDAKEFKNVNDSAGRYLGSLSEIKKMLSSKDPNRVAMVVPFVTALKQEYLQYREMAAQRGVKWNDNGVLNVHDRLSEIERLGGDPTEIKNWFVSNQDILNGVDRVKDEIVKSLIGASKVRNFVNGDVSKAIPSAIESMRRGQSTSRPNLPGTPDMIKGLLGDQLPGLGAPKPAVKPVTPPDPVDPKVTITLPSGFKWTGPRSKAVAAGYLKE